jgi:Xaa-Pro aminopeptidase
LYLDFDKLSEDEQPVRQAFQLAEYLKKEFPYVRLLNIHNQIRVQRTIKKPCELDAMRYAETITAEGIKAMMRASRDGMYEYQYKAEFDYALAQRGVLNPGFPSIISAGKNNFQIHYHSYRGQAHDGDMVLNDVGACWDNEINDVSRGWPVNGRFNDRQRLLYTCAYETSNHMFEILKPGYKMSFVDQEIRRFNYERLHEAGVCDRFENIGTYMWHGGAHHVGYDVHDVVDVKGGEIIIQPGMVFCIDVGIYHEEWGIGFRLEDNCLITEDGCECLSVVTPRSIEEIEEIMK